MKCKFGAVFFLCCFIFMHTRVCSFCDRSVCWFRSNEASQWTWNRPFFSFSLTPSARGWATSNCEMYINLPFIKYNARSVDLIAWYFCRVLGVDKKMNFDWKLWCEKKTVAIFEIKRKKVKFLLKCVRMKKGFFPNSAYYWFATWMSINLMWMKAIEKYTKKPADFFILPHFIFWRGIKCFGNRFRMKKFSAPTNRMVQWKFNREKRKLNGWK